MTRVVLDTNIIVSAALTPQGNEAAVLELVADGRIVVCATPPILAEYEDVLLRPSLRLDPAKAHNLLATFYALAIVVRPAVTVDASPHEADNRFLECAETVEADFLVTGNRRHFPPRWKNTRIVNSRELLAAVPRTHRAG